MACGENIGWSDIRTIHTVIRVSVELVGSSRPEVSLVMYCSRIPDLSLMAKRAGGGGASPSLLVCGPRGRKSLWVPTDPCGRRPAEAHIPGSGLS